MHTDNHPGKLSTNILEETVGETNYPYVCTQCVISHKDFGTIQTYGIAWACGYRPKNVKYPDVYPDKDKVRLLVKLMNELQLDRVHMKDVIEDFLADPSALGE